MGDIINYNIRGLKTVDTRRGKVEVVTKLLSEHELKILNIQETRLTDETQIPQEFIHLNHIFEIIFCGANNLDQGSGILVFIKKTEEVIEKNILFNGRLLHIKIKNTASSEIMNFFSFYGKSNVNKNYAENIVEKINNTIENGKLENIILCGDLNFVTSIKDRNTNTFTQTDKIYKEIWVNIQLKHNLLDAFRKLYPKRRLYTFHQTGGTSKSRIDRIYLSADISGRVQKMTFENSKESDHKIVRLTLGKNVKFGPGTWIFNNTLLKDTIFVEEIRQIIHSYTRNNPFPKLKIAWDFLQMEIKQHTKKYAKKKSMNGKREIAIIRNKLEILESLHENKITQDIKIEIDRLRQLDFEYNDKILKGYKIRSRLPHFEEGECDISFYAKLEKRKGEENLIFSLEDENGIVQEGTTNLIKTIHGFYTKLYEKEPENDDYQNELLSEVNISLTEDEKQKLDLPLLSEEMGASLKSMQTSKTPGSSGLTQEFLWFYWSDLSIFFQELINEIYEDDFLSESQKKGIIKISYKKNGRQFIKNYRPITLLNTDLKVITKTLAKRLASVLNNVIHDSQKCVKGRKITENIHLAQDLIDAILKDKSSAAYIFIDQEKAFDRVSHNFLFKTLNKFGVGENFIKWVKIIYKDATSKVKVNGFFTDCIKIKRGVRQGCPLSALLYVLCAEVLTTNIRNNVNIKGYILRNKKEHKESMYADDLKVCVTTENSITELFKLFDKYEKATNSKINKDKTEALWLGNWMGRTDKPLNLKWTSGEVNFTGIYVGNNRSLASQRTFDGVVEKMKNKMAYWNTKYISKKGKVRILNIYGLTKLWYALEVHDISNDLCKIINNMCKTFIWNGYHQRPLSVLIWPYDMGGLSLQSIETKIKTLRIRWLERLMTQKHLECERNIVDQCIGNVNNYIKGLEIIKYSKNYERYIDSSYYKNAYNIWRKNKISFWPKDLESIKKDWIYYNILLTDDDGRVFKPPGRIENNLPNYFPSTFDDLPVRVPIGDLRGIFRTLIPNLNFAFHRICFSNQIEDIFQITNEVEDKQININGKFKDIYSSILLESNLRVKIWENKWQGDLGGSFTLNWEQIWTSVHNKMLNYKIQSSIWEMIHRNYICGYILKKMNRGDGICKLCNTLEQKRTHIFMTCQVTEQVYEHYRQLLANLGPTSFSDSEKAFGMFEQNDKKTNLRNYFTYALRHIVYRNRNIEISNRSDIVRILVNKVKAYIKQDLTEKFNIYKHKRKLEQFKQVYLIEDIIGKIENNNLFLSI